MQIRCVGNTGFLGKSDWWYEGFPLCCFLAEEKSSLLIGWPKEEKNETIGTYHQVKLDPTRTVFDELV